MERFCTRKKQSIRGRHRPASTHNPRRFTSALQPCSCAPLQRRGSSPVPHVNLRSNRQTRSRAFAPAGQGPSNERLEQPPRCSPHIPSCNALPPSLDIKAEQPGQTGPSKLPTHTQGNTGIGSRLLYSSPSPASPAIHLGRFPSLPARPPPRPDQDCETGKFASAFRRSTTLRGAAELGRGGECRTWANIFRIFVSDPWELANQLANSIIFKI